MPWMRYAMRYLTETLLVILVFSFFQIDEVQGAVLKPLSLAQLVSRADAVVRGRVVRSQSWQDEDGGRIFTRHFVEVSATYRGQPRELVEVVTLGGEVDSIGIGQLVPGEAKLVQGEEVVLCLRKTGGEYRPLGMAMGKFAVDGKMLKRDMNGVHLMGNSTHTVPGVLNIDLLIDECKRAGEAANGE